MRDSSQGADRVNEELEVGFDQKFEVQWHHAEQWGHVAMLVFVLAGLAGVLGRGPYSHRTEATAASGLSIDFEPIARAQAGTQVTFHFHNETAAPSMSLFVSGNIVEPMGLQRSVPQPLVTQVVDGGLLMTIAVPPGTKDAELRMLLSPVGMGMNHLTARLEERPSLAWSQFVVP